MLHVRGPRERLSVIRSLATHGSLGSSPRTIDPHLQVTENNEDQGASFTVQRIAKIQLPVARTHINAAITVAVGIRPASGNSVGQFGVETQGHLIPTTSR